MRWLFSIIVLLVLISCEKEIPRKDRLQNPFYPMRNDDTERTRKFFEFNKLRAMYEVEWEKDSIYSYQYYTQLMESFNPDTAFFKDEMLESCDTCERNISIKRQYTKGTKGKVKFLISRVSTLDDVFIFLDGFKKDKQVVHHEVRMWWENYMEDTIFDVNNDGYDDFLIQWFPSSGCCPRECYDIYIFNHKTNSFNEPFDVINPVFYPGKKLIRGMGYGYGPSLYTKKWNQDSLETVEYFYHNLDDSIDAQYISSDKDHGDTSASWIKYWKQAPAHYKELDYMFEWFEGGKYEY
ncbi:hypothetical protein K6119_13420 [Paracrocinitomix mangrovi]|uniref:hypothetical protein n=1 Tax=Paracrocinitomix mangrovi TaxID=2862509 RepID=UPI001C8D96A4|nr:hypothetical protein [Paracrocinitomix mangrovi]UKN00731.1 hypothetical protein K6119_13420 [Paracrocinitomix mangrovi]